ncbi:MAG: DUF6252 family protein [Candidatus Cyclobacteriaceae bacterium M2_1C_046]
MKNIISCLLLTIILPFISCTEDVTRGTGGISFKLNNVYYTAACEGVIGCDPTIAGVKSDTFALSAKYSIDTYHSVGFKISNFSGPGHYELNMKYVPSYNSINYGRYNGPGRILSSTDSLHRGIVRVTYYDPTNKIVSGTFEFNTIDTDTGLEYKISEGNFDTGFIFYE